MILRPDAPPPDISTDARPADLLGGGMGAGGVRLVSAPHVFAPACLFDTVASGATVAEIVGRAGLRVDPSLHARVWVDDIEVPAAMWGRVRPKPGRTVTVRAIAHGGGGGKNPLRLLLQVAVLAASFFVPALPLLGSLTGPILGAVGMLAVNLLVPPTMPKLPSSGESSQTYSLTGGSNQVTQYGPVPVLLGRHRIVPPYAATPYTELVGKDQFLRVMYLLGHGPITVTDLRLGDTPISSYRDVEIEIREGRPSDAPRRLYTRDVNESALNIEVVGEAGWFERATGTAADEISVDITLPFGLIGYHSSGNKFKRDVTIQIQYRPIAGGSWVTPPGGSIFMEEQIPERIRRGVRWSVPRGQYLVRLRKLKDNEYPEDGRGSNIVYWTALRTIRAIDPIQLPGMATVALRIRANEQLNGSLDPFNCVAQAEYLDWDGSGWVPRATSNPASAFRQVLQGPATRRPLPDARLDLDNLAEFHSWCAAKGYAFNAYLDADGTVDETLRLIAAAGRASRATPDGRHGVVIDRPQSLPVQMLTARNSWGFKGTKVLRRPVHGLRIRFINAEADWQQDERTVYADGHDETTATELETDEAFGVTDPEAIWRLGRYRLAQQILRPETFEVWADVENLVCTRGDLVLFSRDTILVGQGTGRITGLTVDAGAGDVVTAIAVDEAVVMAAGRSYAVAIRTVGHGIVSRAVVNPASADPVETRHLTLAVSIPAGVLADPEGRHGGDLVAFGEGGFETLEGIVTRITPGEDLSAKLTLMQAAPGVHVADQGAIPPWSSGITRAARIAWASPPAPVIGSVRSDETVLLREPDGALTTRILISLAPQSAGDGIPPAAIQVRVRETGSQDWRLLPPYPGDSVEVGVTEVDDRGTYDIDLRAVGENNRASGWTQIRGHYVIGKSTPPPPVPRAWRLATPDGSIKIDWTYPDPPPDFKGFRVKSHAGTAGSWATAALAHPGTITAGPYDVGHVGYGLRTVLIRAVDVAGNESVASARLVIDFGPAVPVNVLEETDLHPDWPGLLPAGEVDAGTLAGAATVQFWEGAPGREIWRAEPDAPFWGTGGYTGIDYWYVYTPSQARRLTVVIDLSAPQGWTLDWCEAADFLAWSGGDDAVWWTDEGGGSPPLSDDEIWWTGIDDGDWRTWPGAAQVEEVEYLFRLRAPGGPARPVVTSLTMTLDVDDVVMTVDSYAISADGTTRLPLSKPVQWIHTIQLTLEDDGGGAFVAQWVDKDASLGPLVRVYDETGALTAGTVDATIIGAAA